MSRTRRERQRAQAAERAAPAARSRLRWVAPLLLCLCAGGAFAYWRLRLQASAPAPAAQLVVPDPHTSDMEAPVQEIIAQTRRNVLVNPRSAEAWGWYAAVLDAHQFYDEAEPCYRRAHELAPKDVRFAYNLALVLEYVGAEPDEGLALLRAVAELQPKFPPVHVRIGHCLASKGDYAAAADAYRAALALDPGLAIARRALGQMLIELEDFAAAALELERVAATAAEDGPTQAALARVYSQRGDEQRSIAATERARGLKDTLRLPDPLRFQVIQQGRSSRLAGERLPGRVAEGDFAGAAEDLKLILRTRPKDPKLHEQLAEAYQRLGQKGLADQELAEARRLRSAP